MKATPIILFMLIIMYSKAVAGELAEIEMVDGSIIQAEILSLRDGLYTVRSSSLGTLDIEQSRVRSIRQGPHAHARQDSAPQTSGLSDSAAQIRAMAEAMISNKDIMDKISTLGKDPDIMNIMQDPEIMKAVNTGDVAALMANSNFLKIMNNPAIQEIIKKVNP